MNPEQFSHAVLNWYDLHGRKDLPWQQAINPYRVWVSEIMLQQTQVSTVLGYFDRFIHALPDVQSLANAAEDEVLHLWTGLGYYSRARNLQKTAQIICTEHGGEFPRDIDQLCNLPGIGRSTAGAIASLSMGLRAPILDGNVKRVLARYIALEQYPGEPTALKTLWAVAEQFTPKQRVNHYTQAMMDLGATLCTRSKPSCLLCPLQSGCQAHAQGLEHSLPRAKPRKELPRRQTLMPIIHNQEGAVLLYRRPASGLWGGLWSLPEFDSSEQVTALAQRLNLTLSPPTAMDTLIHTFSHFQLAIAPQLIAAEHPTHAVAESDWLWYNLANPPRLGLAAPVKKLLKRATQMLAGENP